MVVRGDVVLLGTGDVVPADLRLVKADDVKVSEMALTGEPDDVGKTEKVKPKKEGVEEKLTPENCVFAGLINEKGPAKKKCFCLPDTSANQTPLQNSLEQ